MKEKTNFTKILCWLFSWLFPLIQKWNLRFPILSINLELRVKNWVRKEYTLAIIWGYFILQCPWDFLQALTMLHQLFLNPFHLLSDWREGTGFNVQLWTSSSKRPKHWGCNVNSELQIIHISGDFLLFPLWIKQFLSNSTD